MGLLQRPGPSLAQRNERTPLLLGAGAARQGQDPDGLRSASTWDTQHLRAQAESPGAPGPPAGSGSLGAGRGFLCPCWNTGLASPPWGHPTQSVLTPAAALRAFL